MNGELADKLLNYFKHNYNSGKTITDIIEHIDAPQKEIEDTLTYMHDVYPNLLHSYSRDNNTIYLIRVDRSNDLNLFLKRGGYTVYWKQLLEEELNKEEENRKRQIKEELELQNLREAVSNYKTTRIQSWIAIIISLAALIVSIATCKK